ncbi:MAG: DUF58 domain-containing protein [Myxococcota bacterium]
MKRSTDCMEFDSKIKDTIYLLEEFRKAIIESDIVLDEMISGLHKSRVGGNNIEFLDYRDYVYGDDLKYVDWKVLLRSNKYFIKRFDDTKRNQVYIFLDTTDSMSEKNRFLRAVLLIVAISNIFIRMKDDVYLIMNDEKIAVGEFSGNAIIPVMTDIFLNRRFNKGDFIYRYERLLDIVPGNSILCLFSDLFSKPEVVIENIRNISATGIFQYIFHIINDNELNPDLKGLKMFIDPDSENKLLIQSDNIWEDYKNILNDYIKEIDDILTTSAKGRYLLCPENLSLRDTLIRFFEKR